VSRFKFRAWNTTTEKIIDLKTTTPLALDADLDCDGVFIPFLSHLKIMQYTGLKDKNGKEIFEGDIVETSSDEVLHEDVGIYTVKFLNGSYRLIYSEQIHCTLDESEVSALHLKIIGNIHEHPELLSPESGEKEE